MKAIRIHEFGDPSVLKGEDIPAPQPAAQQVLIDIKAIGVNPVDTYIRAGKYGPRQFPFTPGFDAAGIVKSVGAGVPRLKMGARVYLHGSLSGTYAEQALCQDAQVHPLPDSISFEQGAGVGVPYFTAYYALTLRGQARPGERLLIHGASGGVGIAAIQIARLLKLHIIGTGGSERGRALIREQGAAHVLDHTHPAYLDDLLRLTEGHGPDLILEMMAHINLGKDLKVLAKGGRVVVIGSRGPVEIDPRDTMSRNASILGMSSLNATPDDLNVCHAAIVGGLKQGVLKPVIGQTFPLSQAAEAQTAILAAGAYGKIILLP